MTVGDELFTFISMCTRNGIGPADGLDMLVVDPDWFAADDGVAAAPRRAVVAGSAARRVRRHDSIGPCPPP